MIRLTIRAIRLLLFFCILIDASNVQAGISPTTRPLSPAHSNVFGCQAVTAGLTHVLHTLDWTGKRFEWHSAAAEGLFMSFPGETPGQPAAQQPFAWAGYTGTGPAGAGPQVADPALKAEAARIQALAQYFDWAPGVAWDVYEPVILEVLGQRLTDQEIDRATLENRLRQARPHTRQSFIRFFSDLSAWLRLSDNSNEVPLPTTEVRDRLQFLMARRLTGEPEPEGSFAAELAQSFAQPALQEILQPMTDDLVRRYVEEFGTHLLSPGDLARRRSFAWRAHVEKIRRQRWKAFLAREMRYDVLRSDLGRFLFAPALWILMGSFINGSTTAAVAGFLAGFAARPLYQGLLVNLENSIERAGAPLPYGSFPYGITRLPPDADMPEIRRAYAETLTLLQNGETLHPGVQLYLYEKELERVPAMVESAGFVREIRRAVLSDPEYSVPDRLWSLLTERAAAEDRSLYQPEIFFLHQTLGLSGRSPYARLPSARQLWLDKRAREIPSTLRLRLRRGLRRAWLGLWRSLLGLALGVPQRALRRFDLLQLQGLLLHWQNRGRVWLGFAPRAVPEESPEMRRDTQLNPFTASEQDGERKQALLAYMRGLKIPELEPLVQILETDIQFKFEPFADSDWYPRRLQRLIDPAERRHFSSMHVELDLLNRTLLLSSKTPDFVNAMVVVKLAAMVYRHQVIFGHRRDIHLPGPAAAALLRRVVSTLTRDLLRDGQTHFGGRRSDYVITVFHFASTALHALFGAVYSRHGDPPVLRATQYNIFIRPFMKAREGFLVSAYLLFAPRSIAITDQPAYPVAGAVQGRWTKAVRIFHLLRPALPLLIQMGSALMATGLVTMIFSGFLLHLDLDFMWQWVIDIKDVLAQIDIFHFGRWVRALWHSGAAVYEAARLFANAFLRISFHIDLAWLRAWLHRLNEALAPLRYFVQHVLLPFLYQFLLPLALFLTGMINGYIQHRLQLKQRLLNGRGAVAGELIAAGVGLILGPYQLAAQWWMDDDELNEQYNRWRLNLETSRLRRSLEALLWLFIHLVFIVRDLGSIGAYLVFLALLTYPVLDLKTIVHFIQSCGVPFNPVIYISLLAFISGVPFSHFYALQARLSRRLSESSWKRAGRPLTLTAVAVLGFFTVVAPTVFNHFYRDNPMLKMEGLNVPAAARWIHEDKRAILFGLQRWIDDTIIEARSAEPSLVSESVNKIGKDLGRGGSLILDRFGIRRLPAAAGPLQAKRLEETAQKMQSRSISIVEKLRPRRFVGLEALVDPVTGRPMLPAHEGSLIDNSHFYHPLGLALKDARWVQAHKPEILRALRSGHPALRGNSAFFAGLFDDIYPHSPQPLLDVFTVEEWREILELQWSILARMEPQRTYAENYYYQALALKVLDAVLLDSANAKHSSLFSDFSSPGVYGVEVPIIGSELFLGRQGPPYLHGSLLPACFAFDSAGRRMTADMWEWYATAPVADPDLRRAVRSRGLGIDKREVRLQRQISDEQRTAFLLQAFPLYGNREKPSLDNLALIEGGFSSLLASVPPERLAGLFLAPSTEAVERTADPAWSGSVLTPTLFPLVGDYSLEPGPHQEQARAILTQIIKNLREFRPEAERGRGRFPYMISAIDEGILYAILHRSAHSIEDVTLLRQIFEYYFRSWKGEVERHDYYMDFETPEYQRPDIDPRTGNLRSPLNKGNMERRRFAGVRDAAWNYFQKLLKEKGVRWEDPRFTDPARHQGPLAAMPFRLHDLFAARPQRLNLPSSFLRRYA